MDKIKTGVVFGRFQPLHNGHVEYISAALEICDHIIFGITNPFLNCDNNIERLAVKANPFNYFQRLTMLNTYLADIGVEREKYEIVPFPIENPKMLKHFIPQEAVLLLSICGWHDKDEKLKIINNLEYKNIILFDKSVDDKITSGSTIRRTSSSVKKLVPPSVFRLIEAWENS